ncbi:hypothetical protein E4U43_004100 [Claviceps pusilla]|uniref:Transmembrane protein n=1 Tax=Claviceps pusilla TaxID=123648 RepID=A0A9P7NHI1_9HYPO|nr:hypothetical protein E4U43_004100 [Claviceps pusilla]
MLFSVYLAMLFVSGRHVHSYVVASGQQYEPARVKKWIWRFGLERLSLRKTRRYIRGIGAVATSLTACDAPRLRFSSRDTHHEQMPNYNSESKRQAESYLPTVGPSVILVGEKDKLWNNAGLVTGIIATLASCIVLGVLFLRLSRRKRVSNQGEACQDVSAVGQSPHRCTQSVASIQSNELFVPGIPNPAWPLPSYCAASRKEQLQPRVTNSMWMPHSVVSPVDSLDGSTRLSNYHPSPIESLDFPIQQPPASYHWQAPVELPATGSPAHDHTQLPPYSEVGAEERQRMRFSWTADSETSYRPSEKLKS